MNTLHHQKKTTAFNKDLVLTNKIIPLKKGIYQMEEGYSYSPFYDRIIRYNLICLSGRSVE